MIGVLTDLAPHPHLPAPAGGGAAVVALAAAALLFGGGLAPVAAQTDLDGAWRADEYALADGVTHPLAGHILFVDGEWSVLFYVLDATGQPVRTSAEGGTYTRSAEDLVFTHLYYTAKGAAVDGLEESPFEMRVNDAGVEEPSRATVNGDYLTLYFPSGNRMTFRRAP